MLNKILWIIFIALALIVGLYPSIYFILDRNFGLLSTKESAVLASTVWNIAFYLHILPGGLALLIGWMQFMPKYRAANLNRHRQTGKIYVSAALMSALAGLYIAYYATGGIIAVLGFGSLAIVWFYTTYMAYAVIRKGNITRHKKFMIYSYAACFAAVTLRLWLPLLTISFHNFILAYRVVAWLCWMPNILVAYLIIKRAEKQELLARI